MVESGGNQPLGDFYFGSVLFFAELCVVAVEIAVISDFEAVGGQFYQSVRVVVYPTASHKKRSVHTVILEYLRNFENFVGILIDVKHKTHAFALFIAAVDYVNPDAFFFFRQGENECRGQRENEHCGYDYICGYQPETLLFHNIKYVYDTPSMCYNNGMQKIIRFDNGMNLVLVQNTAVRSVAIGVFAGAGSVTEPRELSGISHFIEHMAFKGTSTRSAFDIVNEIDSLGAQINAFTTKSYTCFYTVSLDVNAEKCAEVLSDIYFNPAFDDKELAREKKVVVEEINESEDTPDDICLEELASAFFEGHPLEKPILGTKGTLRRFNADTLREYKDKHYTAANTVLSVAGNISEADAVGIAEKYFASCFGQDEQTAREAVSPAETRSAFAFRKKEIEQAHLAVAFPSYGYGHKKSMAVQLLAAIFGMEMSSRLFQGVREKLGLCYTIVGYPSTYENNGAFIIYTATSPENAEEAVRAIRAEIDTVIDCGITEDELKKGKEQLKTSMVLGQESTSSMMRAFGRHAVQTGGLYDIDGRIEEIDALTVEDVCDVAKEVFDCGRASCSMVAKTRGKDMLKVLKKEI